MDLKDLKIERQPTSKRRHKNPWPVRIGLICLLAGAGWAFWPMASSILDQMRLPLVRTFRVQEAAASTAASVQGTAANGYLVAARRAALSSDVPGRIVELNVTEGSVVRQGEIVARLFSDEYRAGWQQSVAALSAATTAIKRAEANVEVALTNITEARGSLATAQALQAAGQAQLEFSEQERNRVVKMAKTGIEGISAQQQAERNYAAEKARLSSLIASVEVNAARVKISSQRAEVAKLEVEEAQNQEKAARAARDQAKATLDKTDVRAPFDGVVVLKDAEVGEVVSPNVQGGGNARGAVCTMVDFDSLEVQANVPETTLASVTVGAPADVFLDAFPDITYPGTVDRIWPTADRQKATVEVRVKLNRKDDRLRPEMGVRVVFRKLDEQPTNTNPTASSRQILIPLEAVVQIAGKSGSFLIERDTVRFQEVTTGKKKGGKVAIDAGLEPNQLIVLDPPTTLQPGDRIRIQTN